MRVRDGAALRSRRQRMGLSQRELAYLCRPCSQTTIYLLETGRMPTLTPELAVRIAKRLDVSVESLFDEPESPRRRSTTRGSTAAARGAEPGFDVPA